MGDVGVQERVIITVISLQGVRLQSSFHGVHQVSGVIALSPAYQCGKIQEGDELVQVNYQTVVSLDAQVAFLFTVWCTS